MRLVSLVTVCLLSLGAMAEAADQTREIIVSGEGIASDSPDMASIRLGVMREARSAGQALELMSEAMALVLKQLEERGIESRDVQTASVGLSPRFQRTNDGRPPKISGYVASNDVRVRVRQLDQLGAIMDAVVGDGANSMNGLSFGISDSAAIETLARRDAVQNAMSKAAVLADAAGVSLGPVLSIHEASTIAAPTPMMRSAMMESSSVPIAEGEVDVRVTITMTIAIADN